MQLSIAEQFSRMPAGRSRADGPFSGTYFRSDYLIPRLLEASKTNKMLVVELDGVLGYSSSFLEEAFGGLLRDPRITPEIVKNNLEIKALSRAYEAAKLDILQYISKAVSEYVPANKEARQVH